MVLSAGRIAGRVVAPTLVAYAAFLLALRAGFRSPLRRRPAAPPPASLDDWRRLVRLLAATALGGYAVFLALILFFYLALGGQGRGFVADALGSGAMLAFAVVVPSFLAMEAARALFRRATSRNRSASDRPQEPEPSGESGSD
jgi:small-conductance mechanosensitive channel